MYSSLSLAALAALALGPIAHGLYRLDEPPQPAAVAALLEEQDDGGEVQLPEITEFSSHWYKMGKSLSARVQWTWKVQLVLGVFSTEGDGAYRDVIRETWMRQQGVCRAGKNPELGCSVHVVFVLGRPHQVDEDDLLFLPVNENMNQGKSLAFLKKAVVRYPWATHFGKMDADVFPHLNTIVKSMRKTRPGCEAFLGKPWSCYGPWCPPIHCGPPQGGDLLMYNTTEPGHCWSYMQGGLYILSRRLAEGVVAPDSWLHNHSIGVEDATLGKAVDLVIQESGVCVDTWRQEVAAGNTAYYHARKGCPCACATRAWSSFYMGGF